MTCVTAILALVSSSVEKELVAESAEHELIELLLHELVAVHLVDFVLALANRALTAETSWSIQRTLAYVLLHYRPKV